MILNATQGRRFTVDYIRNLVDRHWTIADAVNINQRLQPVHTPTRNALDGDARGNECSRNVVRAASDRNGIVRYPDGHMASNNVLNLAPSKRA